MRTATNHPTTASCVPVGGLSDAGPGCSCLMSELLQVLPVEPASSHGQDVDMPMRCMVGMLGGEPLHRFTGTGCECLHRRPGDLAQVEVPAGVLYLGVRADNDTEEDAAFGSSV